MESCAGNDHSRCSCLFWWGPMLQLNKSTFNDSRCDAIPPLLLLNVLCQWEKCINTGLTDHPSHIWMGELSSSLPPKHTHFRPYGLEDAHSIQKKSYLCNYNAEAVRNRQQLAFLKVFMHIQDVINSHVYSNLSYFQLMFYAYFRLSCELWGGQFKRGKENII